MSPTVTLPAEKQRRCLHTALASRGWKQDGGRIELSRDGLYNLCCAELWKHRGQHKREGKKKNKQLKIVDGELREPLVWRQGSQVSMCMARG